MPNDLPIGLWRQKASPLLVRTGGACEKQYRLDVRVKGSLQTVAESRFS